MGYKDSEVGRARNRERFRRRIAERVAQGLCPRCGGCPPAAGHGVCEACAEKRRVADRTVGTASTSAAAIRPSDTRNRRYMS